LALLAAAAVIGTVALFSQLAAAILYIPFFLAFCWYRPMAAIALMMGEVAFPYEVSGSGVVHTAPAEISLCLAFPVFWMKSMLARHPRISNPLVPAVWAYFVVCMISSLVHWTGRDAIVSVGQMALYLLLAVKFFSSFVRDRRQIFAGMYGLIAATTFVGLLLLILREDYVLGIHKNATGTFLSYTVLMLSELWLLAASSGRSRKWLNILLVINLAALVMSTSRGAWMGALVGLAILMLARRQYALFGRALLIMIPAIAICWLWVPQEQRDYVFDVSSSAHNVKTRVKTIDFYEQQFTQSPVIGSGVGLRKEEDSTNIIMSTLAETGVLGLIAFLSIHVVLVWTIMRTLKRVPRTHPDFTILILGLALPLCLFTHGLVDHYWSRTQLPVWGMAGAAIGVASLSRSTRARALR
jgi:hypothetical protein